MPTSVETIGHLSHGPGMERLEKPNRSRSNEEWEHCKALFLAGTSIAKCAELTGIPLGSIKTKAYREKWDSIRTKAKPVVLEARITKTAAFAAGLHEGMEERGRRIRGNLSKAIERQSERLADQPTDCLRDEMDLASTLGKVASAASIVHGWDRESVTSTVRVGAMGEEDGEEPSVQVAAVDAAQ